MPILLSVFVQGTLVNVLPMLASTAHNMANVIQHAQHIGFSTSFIKHALEPPVTAASLLEIPLLFWLVIFYLWVQLGRLIQDQHFLETQHLIQVFSHN